MKFCGLGMEANGQALAFSLNIIFTKIPLIPNPRKNHKVAGRRAATICRNQIRISLVSSKSLQSHPDLIRKFLS